VVTPINQHYSTLYQIDTTKTAETQPDPIGAKKPGVLFTFENEAGLPLLWLINLASIHG
jgi:hypothetical protein